MLSWKPNKKNLGKINTQMCSVTLNVPQSRERFSESPYFYEASRGLGDISSLIDGNAMLLLCNIIATETIKRFHLIGNSSF
jgi:hypothetical protein